MRKKILIISMLAGALFLAGCQNNPQQNTRIGKVSGDAGEASALPEAPGDGHSGITLMRTSYDDGCNNESGYYYIANGSDAVELNDGKYGYHMMYIDFASGQEVYLCNNAGCNHDTTECNAVIDTDEFSYFSELLLHDNSLYLLSKEGDSDGSMSINYLGTDDSEESGNTAPPAALYRMNLDGTDRKRVFTFDAGITVEETILEDETGLYFVTKKLETEKSGNASYTTSSERKLVRLNTATWELETIQTLSFDGDEKGENWDIIGCVDNNLILSRLHYKTPLTNEERTDDDLSMEALRQATEQIAVLPLSQGKPEVVYEMTVDPISSYAVKDRYLYVGAEGEGNIHRIDLLTGEDIIWAEVENNYILDIFQDALCCTSENMIQDSSFTFVDLEDGHVSVSQLSNQSTDSWLDILGETNDSFLVIYDCDKRDHSDGSYEVLQYYYGLIRKEDLYNGNANYIPINMTGRGR